MTVSVTGVTRSELPVPTATAADWPLDSSGHWFYCRPFRAAATISRVSFISVGTWYGMPSLMVHSMPPPCATFTFGSPGAIGDVVRDRLAVVAS